jgi:hypothetical protein
MTQTGARGDYWRLDNTMTPTTAPRQRVQSASAIAICRLDLSLFNNTGVTTGSFHVEIWNDALTAKIGGNSASVTLAGLPTTLAPATPTSIVWTANQPQPAGNFWIVLQSDGNFGAGGLVRWGSNLNEQSYGGTAFNGVWNGGDVHEDFYFSVFAASP